MMNLADIRKEAPHAPEYANALPRSHQARLARQLARNGRAGRRQPRGIVAVWDFLGLREARPEEEAFPPAGGAKMRIARRNVPLLAAAGDDDQHAVGANVQH